ncbi:MAG TPA: efflux RND transporter periplasmic adaptor subunit [Bryobacteraceae bacterium]|nr:efflux RND transporter periplasmic adaptor subunit [Bryobacteraceae bacterium]
MRRPLPWLLLVLGAAAAVAGWWIAKRKNQPPEIAFARVTRETINSTVPTNGKVEPVEWAAARADRAGAVREIHVRRGQSVRANEPLVDLDASDAQAERSTAEARIAQTKAELETLSKGGRAADLAEISSSLDRARLDLETAQKEYAALSRLQKQQAATQQEVTAAKEKVDRAQLQIQSLEAKKSALVAAPDRASAQARLQDAEAALRLADDHIRQSVVRAPIDGFVYQFDLKPGAFLNAGDSVALIGRLERVHVNVYVDEQDLGRVAKGMPVAITWDALPGRIWMGAVDKTPVQIVPLGSRQVGEVTCLIENPNRDLLPGANVNAEIKTDSVENALTIPKEALRREGSRTGVYLLDGERVVWRDVKMGVNNTTRTQVEGLQDGDAVALLSDKPLKNGMTVRPTFP